MTTCDDCHRGPAECDCREHADHPRLTAESELNVGHERDYGLEKRNAEALYREQARRIDGADMPPLGSVSECRICGRPAHVHDVVCERRECEPEGWLDHLLRRVRGGRKCWLRVQLESLDRWLGGEK